jgi:hypothetical protein
MSGRLQLVNPIFELFKGYSPITDIKVPFDFIIVSCLAESL